MKPLVAIVGRPNVGKSTLFNRLAGQRIAIVENTPGVTRDRIYADCEWCGRAFTLIDTGGLELKSDDVMWNHIRTQVEIAVDTADAILYVVDGKTGLTTDDNLVCSFCAVQTPRYTCGQQNRQQRFEQRVRLLCVGIRRTACGERGAGQGAWRFA